MRKKYKTLLSLSVGFSVFLTLSCNKESRWDCFKGTGSPETEVRTLEPFTWIVLEDNIDVFIIQGSTHEVKIEAGGKLIPLIKTEVDSGKLHIYNGNHCNWARSYKKGAITAYVTLPTLTHIRHLGSGHLRSADTLHCDAVEIWTQQTGDADLIVKANSIYTSLHTTGDMTLRGRTANLGVWHNGEGYLYCEDLQAENVWTTVKASGDEYLNASSTLGATINWEGNVYYTGNPVTSIAGTGTGKLIKQD